MAKLAPQPVDILDFQFKLRSRLKIFDNGEKIQFNKPCSSIVAASNFGLVFVGGVHSSLQVIQVQTIEELKGGKENDFLCRKVPLPSQPKFLSVNCDHTKLCVVVEKDSCINALIYDVTSFVKEGTVLSNEIRLSPTPGVYVLDASWNPALPNILTVCKSDGSLGLYELKDSGLNVNELPSAAGATCMCWSPKGKQIAVGSRDGKITQYKPDLKAVKAIAAPPLGGPQTLIALQWISNYQFIGIYHDSRSDNPANIVVVDAPKTGEPTFTNYEDICYSNGNARPVQFYMIFQPKWNVVLVASTNSMEVGVLGFINEQWTQWNLVDAARAELPLSETRQETFPIGLALDVAATKPLQWNEAVLSPAPLLYLLSDHGILCCFDVIYVKAGVAAICSPQQQLSDLSGLKFFSQNVAQPSNTTKMLEKIPVASVPPVPAVSAQPLQQPEMTIASAMPSNTPKLKVDYVIPPQNDIPPLSTSKAITVTCFGTPVTNRKLLHAKSPQQITSKTTTVVQTTVSPTIKGNREAELEALLAQQIRKDCILLESELQAILHKGRSLRIDLGGDAHEIVQMRAETEKMEDFLKELIETCAAQSAEIYTLKQNVIHTWAWYEEARSRYSASQDPQLAVLLKVQPLDPASDKQLADILHLLYYIESQLSQANHVLDEEWDSFQDFCKKIRKIQIPSMETIFQSMVRQNAILQKQAYILKDIKNRIKRSTRNNSTVAPLLLSLDNSSALESELKNLTIQTHDLTEALYENVLSKEKQLTPKKADVLRNLLQKRTPTRVCVNKPQHFSIIMDHREAEETLLGARVSPVVKDKYSVVRNLNFDQSTPKTLTVAQSEINKPMFTFTASTDKLPMEFVKPPLLSNAQNLNKPSDPSAFAATNQMFSSNLFAVPKSNAGNEKLPSVSNSFLQASSNSKPSPVNISSMTAGTTSSIFAPKTVSLSFGNAVVTTSAPGVSAMNSIFAPKTTSSSFQFVDSSKTKPSNFFSNTTNATTSAPGVLSNITNAASKGNSSTPSSALIFQTVTSSSEPKTAVSNSLTFSTNLFTNVPASTTATSIFGLNTKTIPSTSAHVASLVPVLQNNEKSSSATTAFQFTSSSSPSYIFGPPASQSSVFTAFNKNEQSKVAPETIATEKSIFETKPFANVTSMTVAQSSASKTLFVTTSNTSNLTSTSQSSLFENSNASAKPGVCFETSSPAATSALFGTVSSSTSTQKIDSASAESVAPSIFANTPTTSSTTSSSTTFIASPSIFGNVSTAAVPSVPLTTTASLFGKVVAVTTSSTPKSQTVASAVTTSSAVATTSFFNSSANIVSPATTTSVFVVVTPSTVPTTKSIFSTNTTTSASIFGNTTVNKPLIFGTTTATTTTTTTATVPIFKTQATTTTSSVFGTISTSPATSKSSIFAATTPSTQGSIFGGVPVAATTTATNSNAFVDASAAAAQPLNLATTQSGSFFFAKTPSTTASVFGNTETSTFGTSTAGSPAFGQPSVFGNAFSSTAASATTPSFSSAAAPAFGAQSSVFGTSVTTTASFPSTNTFVSASPTTGSIFGQPSAFGSNVFAKTTSSSIFGGTPVTTAASAFGTPNSPFGGNTSTFSPFSPTSTSSSVFGNAASPQTNSFAFGASTGSAPSTNTFGFTSQPSSFGFGTSNAPKEPSFGFGGLNVGSPASTTTSSFGSSFGQAQSQNPFGRMSTTEQKSSFAGGNLFAAPASTAASVFGSNTGSAFGSSTPAFGSNSTFGSSAFGQKPAFGQSNFSSSGSIFGNTAQAQPGPFSGGNQSVSNAGFGSSSFQKPSGFGAAPVFGSASPTGAGFGSPPSFGGAPTFGSSPVFGSPKAFGSSSPQSTFGTVTQQPNTFANLANQNTLGFGNLAQQSQISTSQAPSFGGGSSFSSWR